MVTFGSTTTFSTPAPASATGGFSFGSPAPAPSTTSTGLFGSSTTTPNPAPSTGLFGNKTPAPSTGLFGSTPVAALTTGGLFGSPAPAPAPATGLFGSTSAAAQSTALPSFGSPMGQTPAANNQQTAAIFAQQQEARQIAEAQRLEQTLMKLHAAYNTTNPTTACRFQHIFYDPADTNIIYQYKMMGQRSHQPHVDPKVWAEAEAYNPDHNTHIPVSVVGAEQLQSRVSSQQAKAIKLKETLKILRANLDGVNKGVVKSNAISQTYKKDQERLMQQLLRTLRKVEVLRCMNIPTQSGERKFRDKLNQISKDMSLVNIALQDVAKMAERCKSERFLQENVAQLSQEDQARVSRALRDQKEVVEALNKVSKTDLRDLEIMKNGLAKRLSPYA